METKGRYKMEAHVDGVERHIKEMIEDCKRCIKTAEDTLKQIDENSDQSRIVKEMIYDYDTQVILFKHLLNTITMWRSTVCITEEKLI